MSRKTNQDLMPAGSVEHFHKDSTIIFPTQDSDRKKITCDVSPPIGHISHTPTTSTAIIDLTFKAIIKESVS